MDFPNGSKRDIPQHRPQNTSVEGGGVEFEESSMSLYEMQYFEGIEMMGSPAFQFYAAEYLADENVTLMSLEEEGAYIRLLAYCWREGSIPADPVLAGRLAKNAEKAVIEIVLQRFIKSTTVKGRLIHERLEAERMKQEEFRAKMSSAGAKGNMRRWGSDRVGDKEAITKDRSSSSSSSSSSKQGAAKSAAMVDIPEDLSRYSGIIQKWLQYKREKGQTYKPMGLFALWSTIRKLPPNMVEESIEYSMSNNWSGIFLKKDGQQKRDPVKVNIPSAKDFEKRMGVS